MFDNTLPDKGLEQHPLSQKLKTDRFTHGFFQVKQGENSMFTYLMSKL